MGQLLFSKNGKGKVMLLEEICSEVENIVIVWQHSTGQTKRRNEEKQTQQVSIADGTEDSETRRRRRATDTKP